MHAVPLTHPCMHATIYALTHLRTHARMHVCTHARIHARTHVCTHAPTNSPTQTRTHASMRAARACTYQAASACMHASVHDVPPMCLSLHVHTVFVYMHMLGRVLNSKTGTYTDIFTVSWAAARAKFFTHDQPVCHAYPPPPPPRVPSCKRWCVRRVRACERSFMC